MQRLVTMADMQSIEAAAYDRGCDKLRLVKRAGEACFNTIRSRESNCMQRTFLALIGPGNNGADTTVVVKHLKAAGASVAAWVLTDQFRNVGGIEVKTGAINLPDKLLSDLIESDVIIDGLFGTGSRPLDEAQQQLVRAINQQGKKVIAIDLPTGVDGGTGQLNSVAIKAQLTIALGYAKQGLYQFPGRELAGEIVVEPIGLDDPDLLPDNVGETFLLNPSVILSQQLRIRKNSHKGTYGMVMVVGGSQDYPGAPRLTGVAAYRSGAGHVTLAVEQALYQHMLGYEMGLTLTPFSIDSQGVGQLAARINAAQAVAIGPGFGMGENRVCFIKDLLDNLSNSPTAVVLDADGLNAVDHDDLHKLGKKRRSPLILTPHPREMGRLCGITSDAVQANRIELTREMADRWQAIVVLKGANTLIATPGGALFVFDIDLPALAVAGTGDILTGMISALLAQGVDQIGATRLAVAAHFEAAQRWVEAYGKRGMVADDLLGQIPSTLFPVAPVGDPG